MADLGSRIGPRVSEAKPITNHKVWIRPGYQPPPSQKKQRYSSDRSVDICSPITEGELVRMSLDASSRPGAVDYDRRHYSEKGILGEPITDTVTLNRHHLDNTAGMIGDSFITDENLDISAFRGPLTGKRPFSLVGNHGSHAPQDFRADRHTSDDPHSNSSAATSYNAPKSLLSRIESPDWSRFPLRDRIAPLVRKNLKLRLSKNKFVPNSDEQFPDDESLDAILTPEFSNSILDSLNAARSQLAEKRAAQSSQQDFYPIISEQDKDTSIESPIGTPTTPLVSKPNAQTQSSLPIRTLEQGQDIGVSSDHQQSSRASSLIPGLSSQHIVSAGLNIPLVDTQRKLMLNSAIFHRAPNLPTPPKTASSLGTAFSMEYSRSVDSRSSPNDARHPRSTRIIRRSSSPLARPRRSASPLRSRGLRSTRQWDSSHLNNRRQTSPSCSHERKSLAESSERSLTIQEHSHEWCTRETREDTASNKNEHQQSNASTGENIVDGRASLPRAPTSQSSMRLMPSEQMASHDVRRRETSPQNTNSDISSKLTSGLAQSSADTDVTPEEIDTDMDISSDAEIHISAQVKEGKDHHWKPFSDIPGIWLFKQGSSGPDVLEETFEIPKEIVQKWRSKSLEENMGDSVPPSTSFTEALFERKSTSPPTLSWNLLCVATDSVDALQETLSKSATAKELLQTLSSIQGQWPTNGQLIVEINPDHDIGGVFYGNDLDACITVTGHIHNTAPNVIRFIQLENVSQYVFILFAKAILGFAKACDIFSLEDLQMMFQKSRLDRGSTLITGSVIVEKL